MARNYIIDQCCSVDDLRCHLRNLNPTTRLQKQETELHLDQAIQYEAENGNRVTVIKMLQAKRRALEKLMASLLLISILSSCSRSVVVWNGTDVIGLVLLAFVIIVYFIFVLVDQVYTWFQSKNKRSNNDDKP